jgi:hypothetical protein
MSQAKTCGIKFILRLINSVHNKLVIKYYDIYRQNFV